MYFVSQISHFKVDSDNNLVKEANQLLSIPIPSDYNEKAMLIKKLESVLDEFEAHSNISWIEALNYLGYNYLSGCDANAV